MPDLSTLLVFTLAALVLNISPGPSNFYVLSRSIAQGHGAGLVAAVGLGLGSLVHVGAAAFGVSALFQASATAYTVLKLCGAAYLIWLGIATLRAGEALPESLTAPPPRGKGRILRESALVEALNPKTALFFLAFLPQFVDPAAGAIAPQMLLLGLIVTVTALPCDALVAVASGGLAQALWRSARAQRLLNALSGSMLIGLGLWVAVTRRPS